MKTINILSKRLLLLLFISSNLYAQKSQQFKVGNSNATYAVNDNNGINSNFVLLPLESGELIVISSEGFRLNLYKFDKDLNKILKNEVQVVESAGIKGTVLPTSNFAKRLGDNIFIRIKYSPLGKKSQFEIFKIFDLNLKPVSEWTELGETAKFSSVQYGIQGYSEERKRLEKLGRLHYNDSKIISVSLDEDNLNKHKIRAFETNGELSYEAEIDFDNSNEDLFISSIQLLDDGSLMYIYQHLGKGIYFKLLDSSGELLEGRFPLPEKFILLDNLSNPSDVDQFVLFGLDKDAKPRLFLYSFSGIGEKEIIEFDLSEIEDQYVSTWELTINEKQELYFSGISWKGSFGEGYKNRTNLSYFAINYNTSALDKKPKAWSSILTGPSFKRKVSAKMERYEIDVNLHTKIQFLFEDEGDLYYKLTNYNVSGYSQPYNSFLYDRSNYRTLRVNIKDKTAKLLGPEFVGFFYDQDKEDLLKYKFNYRKKEEFKYSVDKYKLVNDKAEIDKKIEFTHKVNKKNRKNIRISKDEAGNTIIYFYSYKPGKNNIQLARIKM